MAARQSRLFRKKRRFFSTLIGCHGNVPSEIDKKLNEVNKPLQPTTNPEILVKIGLLGQATGSRKLTIENVNNKEKKHWKNI